jgi:hypothetical protein
MVESGQRCAELADEGRVGKSFLEHPEAMSEMSDPAWRD